MTVEASAVAQHPPLLERADELARLMDLVDAACAGRGAAVAVLGPAGIGKTSLLDAARAAAGERGMTCMRARGGELERELANGIAVQLFARAVSRLAPPARATVLDGAASIARPVLGLGGDLRSTGNDAAFAVAHGLYWLTANLAQRAPLLITVDDVHWADAASLRFLAYLARRVEELPVLLLLGSRPQIDGDRGRLLDALTEDAAVLVLRPAPLSAAATTELLAARAGADPDPAFAAAAHEATGGNPFLCSTLAAALADEAAAPEGGTPRGVEALVAGAAPSIVRRLGRLPPPAGALANAVAVLGTEVEPRRAAALVGLGLAEAAAAADALAQLGILRSGSPLEFAHPLVRAAVRDAIPAGERALMHRDAGRLLLAEHAPSERVAVHLLASEADGQPWVVEALLRAAAMARGKGDATTAITYLERALREPPPETQRAVVLRELGRAELVLGSPGAAEHLAAARRLTTDAVPRAEIAAEIANAISISGGYAAAAEVLVDALAELGNDHREVALGLEGQRLNLMCVAPGGLTRTAESGGHPGFEPEGRTRAERLYLSARCTLGLLRFERPERVREWAGRAVAGGVAADVAEQGLAWHNIFYPLVYAGGYELAERMTADAFAEAQRVGSPLGVARALQSRAVLRYLTGNLREAEADGAAAARLGRDVGLRSAMIAVSALVDSLTGLGELDRAEAALAEFGADGEIPVHFLDNHLLHGRGWLRFAQNRTEDAAADFRELERRGALWHPWNPALFRYRSGLALCLQRGGEASAAERYAREEEGLARRAGAPVAIGVALRTLGLVRGGAEGLELLRRSAEQLSATEARLEHARALVEHGAALRRCGERAAAREPLRAGMERAHGCGARPLAARAREELVATGARPRRPVRSGVDALTPSELRVARMAADGLSNGDIAQALYVTLRTVEGHLTHAYQKLDIGSRAQLRDALAATRPPAA